MKSLTSITVESAGHVLLNPIPSIGETLGGFLGTPFGPVGYFVGGTLGRVAETLLSE